jgi:hypothetical protein
VRANTRDFNGHPYGQSPPVLLTVSNVVGFASSTTSTPCRRITDPTHRDTINLRNLAFGRDPEGGTRRGHRFGIYKDPWRKKHHIHHHHRHHQHLHLFPILVVIPRSCGLVQVVIHLYVYHLYYHYDVDCLHL